jgi:tetratricopeptide (TPR) repeat protein
MKGIHNIACVRFAAIAAAALLASCETAPPAPPKPVDTASPAVSAPAQPTKPQAPDLTPAQARAQAQAKAIEAVDQLQNGDEASARNTLEQVLLLDPSNDLGKKLREQIEANAEKELGSAFFRYTVQPGDSMSRLAQQYLGDRFRFYILAKYNDIPNPSKLSAGQVIKIPGKAPPPGVAARSRPDTTSAEPAPSASRPPTLEPEAQAPAPQNDVKTIVAKAAQLQKSGDLEGAYAAYNEAARRDSGNVDVATQRDAVRQALIRRYEREAVQAFQRQNLDMAIARWNNVLELDPNNQKAKLERERAVDLKKRMAEKFGG